MIADDLSRNLTYDRLCIINKYGYYGKEILAGVFEFCGNRA